MTVLVVTDRTDPTAETFAAAAAELGCDSRVIDLRRDRVGLQTRGESDVVVGGRTVRPVLVVNRTRVTAVGLPNADLLRRQRASRWSGRHVAAREEQGLMLAVFDRWGRSGIPVINPPRSSDLFLMELFVRDRLARRGVVMAPLTAGTTRRMLVLDGRVVLSPGERRPSDRVLRVCQIVAEAAEFDLGEVGFATGDGDWLTTGWDPMPVLGADPDIAWATARTLMSRWLGPESAPPGADRPRSELFLPDLEEILLESLEQPPR